MSTIASNDAAERLAALALEDKLSDSYSSSGKFDPVEEFRRNFVKGLWSNPTVYSESSLILHQQRHHKKLQHRSQTLPGGVGFGSCGDFPGSSSSNESPYQSAGEMQQVKCSSHSRNEKNCDYNEVVVNVERCDSLSVNNSSAYAVGIVHQESRATAQARIVNVAVPSSSQASTPKNSVPCKQFGISSGVVPFLSGSAAKVPPDPVTDVCRNQLVSELKQKHASWRNERICSDSDESQSSVPPVADHQYSVPVRGRASSSSSAIHEETTLLQDESTSMTSIVCRTISDSQHPYVSPRHNTPTKIRTTPKRPAPQPPVQPAVIVAQNDDSSLSHRHAEPSSSVAVAERSSSSSPSKDSAYSSSTPNGRADTSLSRYTSHRGSQKLSETSRTVMEQKAVVAIDFGSATAGYTSMLSSEQCSRTRLDQPNVKQSGEGRKFPSCLLLNPDKSFNSFGYTARQRFFGLTPQVAAKHFFFDQFRDQVVAPAIATSSGELSPMIVSQRGDLFSAVDIFAHVLRSLAFEALAEVQSQVREALCFAQCQWIITVPTSWRQITKQLMRKAAVQAGLIYDMNIDNLLMVLDVDAAACFCRSLMEPEATSIRSFLVLSCGNSTVDFGLYKIDAYESKSFSQTSCGTIGAYGASVLDAAFEKLLSDIFSKEFICRFKAEFPAAFAEIRSSFDAKKGSATGEPLTITLPVCFLNAYKKCLWHKISCAVERYNKNAPTTNCVVWSKQGFLQIKPEFIRKAYSPMFGSIRQCLKSALVEAGIDCVDALFLVGGFAEASFLQADLRALFGNTKVIVPTSPALLHLKGAALYGCQPELIKAHRARQTYGIGVLHRFRPEEHPESKRLRRNGVDWCVEVFEKFVSIGQLLSHDWKVTRYYCPATFTQTEIILHIYTSTITEPRFVTDASVKKYGVLSLKLEPLSIAAANCENRRREVAVAMEFRGAELKFTANLVNEHSLNTTSAECTVDFYS